MTRKGAESGRRPFKSNPTRGIHQDEHPNFLDQYGVGTLKGIHCWLIRTELEAV